MNPTAGDERNGEYHYSAKGEPLIDYAARAQAQAEKEWRDDPANKDADMSGLVFPVRKVMARDA